MGWFKKILRGTGASPVAGESRFKESETAVDQVNSRNGPRRELVQLVLRNTMRKNGIPSDWLDCRILSVLTRQHKSGVHVQFLVRKGEEQLLHYVHAFQESFHQEIDKFDPHAKEWLFSVAWQFYGKPAQGFAAMPHPSAWADKDIDTRPPEADDTLPPEDTAGDLASDLEALQAVMSRPAGLADLPAAKPRPHRVPSEA